MTASAVRLYIEGGGDDQNTKRKLKEGFGTFLKEIRDLCRQRGVHWDVILCGGRGSAYKDFCAALQAHPEALCLLLVDAEAPVTVADLPWKHLFQRDRWACPEQTTDMQCHLMAQVMESWFLADPDTLARYYGSEFKLNALPKENNVEKIAKTQVETCLKQATQHTKTKGEYHKIRHGAALLGLIRPALVKERAPHCRRLFDTLRQHILLADPCAGVRLASHSS